MKEFKFAAKEVRSVGPASSDIWFISFRPSQREHKGGYAFQGGNGMLVMEALDGTGLSIRETHRRIIIPHLPPLGKTESWHVSRTDVEASYRSLLGPIGDNKFLHPECLPYIAELQAALQTARPNVVVALGAEASRILIGKEKISQCRGAIHDSVLVPGVKVIPTYNPASCFANHALQPIFKSDIQKAVRESAFPEIRTMARNIYVAETVDDLWDIREQFRHMAAVTVDIETVPARRQITDVGVAFSERDVLVIPIIDKTKEDYSYWSHEDEFRVWDFIHEILIDPGTKVRGQGYIYDAAWLYDLLGLPSINYYDDSLVLHHALYPEVSKDLGFLASVYCDEIAWKHLASFKAGKENG